MQNSFEDFNKETQEDVLFINFTPPPGIEKKIRKIVGQIESQAPSYSSLKFYFHQSKGLYNGSLGLHSYYISFYSSASAKELTQVIDQIFHDIQNQIEQWKRNRTFPYFQSWDSFPAQGTTALS